MEITLNVNLNSPAIVDLIREAMKISSPANAPKPTPGVAAAPSPVEPVAETTKAAPKTSKPKAAPAPVANVAAAAVEGSTLTRDEVKARLSDYAADKRFGMDGVFAILKRYGVQRISDLPESEFVVFKAELDEALGKSAPVVDLLA